MKMRIYPLALFAMTICCQANAENPVNTVDVHGVGVVIVPSDSVVLRLSVATCHADIQEAKKRNDQITTPIYELAESQHLSRPTLLATRMSFDFVTQQRVANQEDEDAQSYQQFEGVKGGKKGVRYPRAERPEPPVHLSRNLELKFRDLSEALKFLAEMVKWDSVRKTCELQVAPLSFGIASRDEHLAEARRRAVSSAREKAQLLAEQNGLKLGRATLIYDDSPDFVGESATPAPTPTPFLPGERDPFGAALPIEMRGTPHAIRLAAMQREVPKELDLDHVPPAQVTITASVKIVFEINKP